MFNCSLEKILDLPNAKKFPALGSLPAMWDLGGVPASWLGWAKPQTLWTCEE